MSTKKQHKIIRISKENIQEAIAVRSECYLQDYEEILPYTTIKEYSYETDLAAIESWYFENTEDYRTGYLYYLDHVPVGMVMGSMADLGSGLEMVEVNYLFVAEKVREQGVGQKLLVALGIEYYALGVKKLCLYNWRDLKSNGFYRHLEPNRIETITQHLDGKALETDIFYWHIVDLLKRQSIDKIAWFSGTGGTQYIAEELRLQLLRSGRLAMVMSITECLSGYFSEVMPSAEMPTDRFYILYPVYALAEPLVVRQWLEQLQKGQGTKTIVLSVSGGGEVWPNTSCRRKVIQLLTERDYAVIYERMFVMPPNMLIEAEPDLVGYLFRAIPDKLRHMLFELEMGVNRRERLKLSTVWMRFISEAEQRRGAEGSKIFVVSEKCTGCGHCIEQCPVKNLKWGFEPRRPVFRNNCQLCLKCYYNCPVQAIEAPKIEKWLLKHYDIHKMKALADKEPEKSIEACCSGLLWIGVKRYLKQVHY